MQLIYKIVRKYLFSRKSSQAIHWITGISIFGIAIGSAALILVLSVFNGFEDLVSGFFSKHNPDIKIIARGQKHFLEDSVKLEALIHLEGVKNLSRSFEEVAMFQYAGGQEFGILKGVDDKFVSVSRVDEGIIEGDFKLNSGNRPAANIGMGIRNKLGISISNFTEPLAVFVPDPTEESILNSSYSDFYLICSSVYHFQQESDYTTVISHLEFVRTVLKNEKGLSSIDLQLDSGIKEAEVLTEIERIMGSDYIIKNRYKQDEAFLKIMKLEKWLFYALFCLSLILVSFTIVGTLWMIVLEKRMDISILKSLGMPEANIKWVFINLGISLCGIGLIIGICFSVVFYFFQSSYGIIGVPEDFIIDRYPMEIRLIDFFIVAATVILIGILASYLPARKVEEIGQVFHEE